MLDNFVLAFDLVLSVKVLLALGAGVVIGYCVGAMPGLTSSIGMALLIPFTFGMDAVPAIVMLVAIYMAADYAAGIPAILVNAPGQPAAAVTAFDGYPMVQRGEAGRALNLSILASGAGVVVDPAPRREPRCAWRTNVTRSDPPGVGSGRFGGGWFARCTASTR